MATTESLAADLGVKPQTLRSAFCNHGSYFGLKPDKLPNGRLDWPDNGKDRLKAAAAAPAQQAARLERYEWMRAGKRKVAP